MNVYSDHPSNETLEEYAFHRLPEHHVETIETHLLACEFCLDWLEAVELHIATMKAALGRLQVQQHVEATPRRLFEWAWLQYPRLSCAAAAALIAVFVFIPQVVRRSAPMSDVVLHAYRGSDVPIVPDRSTKITFDAISLPVGPVSIQIVDASGVEVWTGWSTISNDKGNVYFPKMTNGGEYFLRVYSLTGGHDSPTLLREFAFQVQK